MQPVDIAATATLAILDASHAVEDTLDRLDAARGPETERSPVTPCTVRTAYTLAWHVSDDGEVISVYPVRLTVGT